VWHGSRCGDHVSNAISSSVIRRYGREATRNNRTHHPPTGNVIGWWTNKYGIYLATTANDGALIRWPQMQFSE
jgi:hypothetical protein